MFFKMPAAAFQRQDETDDANFYSFPRLVQHIDDSAIAAVTTLYRDWLPAGGAVLDLMSSWISHLPEEVEYNRVAVLGMNQQELAANPRADDIQIHDLNLKPLLPYEDNEFDAATICVSIDYLTQPVAVLAELSRVLKPGGVLIISFSNRCFPTKAIAVWLQLSGSARGQLVTHWIAQAGGFSPADLLDLSPAQGDPLFAVVARAT